MSSGVPSRFNELAVRCCSLNSGFSTKADANFVGTIPAARTEHGHSATPAVSWRTYNPAHETTSRQRAGMLNPSVTSPGATQLTLMPCGPSSSARALVSPTTAVLLTA